jgi:hypothetical protein
MSRRRLLEQLAKLDAKSVKNARLGLAHGGGTHAQLEGHGSRRLAVDRSSPEGLPARRFELVAQQLQGAPTHPAGNALLFRERRGFRRGEFLKAFLGDGASFRLGLAKLTSKAIGQFVMNDATQPGSKGHALAVASGLIIANAASDGLEDVLDDIVRIRAQDIPLLADVVN